VNIDTCSTSARSVDDALKCNFPAISWSIHETLVLSEHDMKVVMASRSRRQPSTGVLLGYNCCRQSWAPRHKHAASNTICGADLQQSQVSRFPCCQTVVVFAMVLLLTPSTKLLTHNRDTMTVAFRR
jgi:hypothetical protein